MALNPPKSLFPVPTGSLQISDLPPVVGGAAGKPIQFSLVIPTYNESANIKSIIRILSQLLDTSIRGSYELIVVDDDSPDHTWEVALSLIPYVANLIAIAVATIWNFWVNLKLSWRVTQVK